MGDLSAMTLFEEQLSGNDAELRVDALRKLKVVGDAIGPAATLSNLLPYLLDHTDDEDEILLTMADQLGQMVPSLIPPKQCMPIIDILEQLAGVEETVVRQRAVKSMNSIFALVDAGSMPLLAVLTRLAKDDWFTHRVSACGICSTVYSKSTDEGEKAEICALYNALAQDETPMVRRAAAIELGKVSKQLNAETILVIISTFKALAVDEQDSVRLLAIGGASEIAEVLGDAETTNKHVFPVVKAACEEKSWRVRHSVAKQFPKIATALLSNNNAAIAEDLTECYKYLLIDVEAEVRGAAANNLSDVVNLFGEQIFLEEPKAEAEPEMKDLFTLLNDLAKDPIMEVRGKLASSLMNCTATESKVSDANIIKCIIPLLELLLEDELTEVQLNVLRKLNNIAHLIGSDSASPKGLRSEAGITNIVSKMVQDMNWRVREAVSLLLPQLAEGMGIQKFMLKDWLHCMRDKVADVRNACVTGMKKLAEVADPEWIKKEIFPHLLDMMSNGSYLIRITSLSCFVALAKDESVKPDMLEAILDIVLKAFEDTVANVRIVAVTGLGKISGFCSDSMIATKINPVLLTASSDSDRDCREFAQKALGGIGGRV
jgi:serine/threonine-protein phosphatase 2A regulatory subunit A